MKSIYLTFVAVALISLLISCEASSPVKCPETCNTSECPALGNCACGTHKDSCDCCSFCNKCPGEACSLINNDQCSQGHFCHYASSDPSYMNEHDGVCNVAA